MFVVFGLLVLVVFGGLVIVFVGFKSTEPIARQDVLQRPNAIPSTSEDVTDIRATTDQSVGVEQKPMLPVSKEDAEHDASPQFNSTIPNQNGASEEAATEIEETLGKTVERQDSGPSSEIDLFDIKGKEPTYYHDFDDERVIAGPPLKRGNTGGAHYLECISKNGHYAWWRQDFSNGVIEVTGRVVEESGSATGWIVNLARLGRHTHGVRFVVFGDGRMWVGPNMFDADSNAGPKLRQLSHIAIKPAGQWNTLRIVINDDVIAFWVNSEQLCDAIQLDSTINPGHVALGIHCPGSNRTGRVEFDSLAVWNPTGADAISEVTRLAPNTKNTDEQMAQWVREVGGMVTVTVDGRTSVKIAANEDLPKRPLWLTEIDFDETDDRFRTNDLERIAGLAHLQTLNLWNVPLTNSQLACVGDLQSLRTLWLNGTPISDEGLTHLRKLRDLERLHLESTVITDRGISFLESHDQLVELRLEDTQVTDAGLQHLKAFPRLYWLGLDGTAVTNEGLAALAEIPNLTMLHLNRTSVTDAGLIHLERLPNLEVLFVENTSVTSEGIKRLEERLPRCRVVR